MKQYLLDTNICIYLLKGLCKLNDKIIKVGVSNCFISEITIAELKYGIEKSVNPEKNRENLRILLVQFGTISIISSLGVYAREKARLKKDGLILDDFDLLISATAISNNLVLITRNVSDFQRLIDMEIENWAV